MTTPTTESGGGWKLFAVVFLAVLAALVAYSALSGAWTAGRKGWDSLGQDRNRNVTIEVNKPGR